MWIPVKLLCTTLVLLLEIRLTFSSNVRSEQYLIASSPDQCDSLEAPCMTLSSFAANTSNYLQSNTTLVLLPGNHTLCSNLIVKHINQLWLHSNTSDSLSTTIFCINHTIRFEFTNVSGILISGAKFSGCGGNRAELVANFTLINTIFYGQQKALKLVSSTVKTENSSFISNSGGAVIVKQSTATFINCKFNGNQANNGGAIYGDVCNNISIAHSVFYLNSAASHGGAIFAQSSPNVVRRCMLSILTSNFSHNKAHGGGAIAAFHINVSINESNFMNNQAKSDDGGALLSDKSGTTTINGTVFNSNNATYGCGGAVHMHKIKLLVFNNTFN